MKLYQGLFTAICVVGLCNSNAFAFEADNASTPTLWAIADPAERVEADKKRRGDYYANRIKLFLEENQTTVTPGGIVFIGDSITNRFPLDEAYRGQSVYNRGIGGDRIEGILERLDCSVIALKPKAIHCMIGTNDVLWPVDYKNGNLGQGYDRLFAALKAVAPQAKLIAYTVLPIDKRQDRLGTCLQDVVTANKQLAESCKKYGVQLVDMYADFATADGEFKPGLASDGVHLSLAGYLAWLSRIPTDCYGGCLYPVWKNLSPQWLMKSSDTIAITNRNGYRALNTMVLYSLDKDSTTTGTGTNEYGLEAKVEDGKVTSVSPKGNMELPPAPGYVLSAIGDQREWIATNAAIGAEFTLSADGKEVTIVKPAPQTDKERYTYCRSMILTKLATEKATTYKPLTQWLFKKHATGLTEDEMTQFLEKMEKLK